MKQVHWYPGHINKAIREMEQLIKKVDIIILVLDARAPFSSFLPLFKTLMQNKPVLIVLSKKDLADPNCLRRAQQQLEPEYPTIALNLNNSNAKQNFAAIFTKLNQIKVNKLLPKIIILGVPNVGKSTLINFLSKRHRTVVQDRAGVTRQMNWFRVEKYHVMDTPGVLEAKSEDLNVNYRLGILGSIKQSVMPIDEIGNYLLKYLLANKKISFLESDNETIIENYLLKNHLTSEKFYQSLLKNFQKGKYGQVYLDDFFIDFELN